jgi:diacylglycerol O-acyltransferase / wax synthase
MASRKKPGKIRSEPMSRVDTAWLRMERPTNPMMINGVLVLETPLTIDRLRKVIKQRFLSYPRFRQRAVDGATGAIWEDDPGFDQNWHVRRAALPGRAGKRELEQFVSELASTPLDMNRPLWTWHLVEHYHGGSALVSRMHHCYADGIALVQVMLAMTDTTPEGGKGSRLPHAWLKEEDEVFANRAGGLGRYVRIAEDLVEKVIVKGAQLWRDPSLVTTLLKEGGDFALELLRTVALSADPDTALKRPLGGIKRVSWAERIDLDEVKAIGRAYGCTINDVVTACAVGALRGYLIDRGEPVDGLTLRATVPVNLRPIEGTEKLGNQFGLVFLDLPIGEDNPVERLERIAVNMEALKTSKQALMTFGLLVALGRAPNPILQLALEFFSTKSSAVATNVPGPQMPLYMGGQKMTDVMVWVPQTCSVGIGLSIISYNGGVHFGLIADSHLIPDPDAVIRHFRPELDKLLYLAMLSDWEDPVRTYDAELLRARLLEPHAVA